MNDAERMARDFEDALIYGVPPEPEPPTPWWRRVLRRLRGSSYFCAGVAFVVVMDAVILTFGYLALVLVRGFADGHK